MASRVSETLLRYAIDSAALRRVTQANDAVRASLERIEAEAKGLGTSARAGVETLAARFRLLGRDIESDRADARALRDELEKLDNVKVAPKVNVQTTGGGRATNLNDLERGFMSIGGLFPGAGGELARMAGDIIQLTDAFPRFGAALRGLIAPAGLAGAALIGIGAAIQHFSQQIEEGKKALEGSLAAQDRYFDALLTMNETQAREAQATEITRLNLLRQQRDEIEAALALAQGQEGQIPGVLTAIVRAFSTLPTEVLQERLNELNLEVDTTEQLIGRFSGGLRESAFAAVEGADTFGSFAAALVAANRLTKQQRDERQAAIQQEIAVLSAFGGESEAVQQQIEALRLESEALRQTFVSAADSTALYNTQLAQEASIKEKLNAIEVARQKAINGAMVQYTDALTREADVRTKLAQATADGNAFLEKTRANLGKITADLFAKEAELAADTEADRLKAQEKAAEARIKLEKDTEARLRAIRTTASKELSKALAQGDAVAARAAIERREEEIDAERRSAIERRSEIEDGLNDQLREIEDGYRRQLDAARDHARSLEAAEMERYQNELVMRQQTNMQLLTDLNNALSMQRALWSQYLALIGQDTRAAIAAGGTGGGGGMTDEQRRVEEELRRFIAGYTPGRVPGTGGFGNVPYPAPPFAEGGIVGRTGLALVHAGERVIPPAMRIPFSQQVEAPIHVETNVTVQGGNLDANRLAEQLETRIVRGVASAQRRATQKAAQTWRPRN